MGFTNATPGSIGLNQEAVERNLNDGPGSTADTLRFDLTQINVLEIDPTSLTQARASSVRSEQPLMPICRPRSINIRISSTDPVKE